VGISNINRFIVRNQGYKRMLEEKLTEEELAREESYPIHSDSQAADLTLLAECINDGEARALSGIVLGLCEDSTTASRVDLEPAICGDRADQFGVIEHGVVPMETGWVGNRKG